MKTFYNIFQKIKKTRKLKRKPKLKIIADIHEKNSLVLSEIKVNLEIELEITSLKIADYLIGNFAIERKTTNDFISSMINKRLAQQLKQMQKYPRPLLIIEGSLESLYKSERLSKSIKGFILSIINNYKVPIIFTQNYKETAEYLITLAKQHVKPKVKISLHSKIPKTIKEQKQYILESFPNIGPVKAKKLLKKFKTIKNIINSSEQELFGILRKKTKDFKNLVENK